MRRCLFLASLVVTMFVLAGSVDAAVIDVLRYELGELGSFSGELPLDSVGTRDEIKSINGVTPGGVLDTAAPGSTNATRYSPFQDPIYPITGAYGADSTGLPADNFVVEVWARSADVGQPTNDFLVLNGNTNGSVSFRAGNGVWAGHIFNLAWVGAADGTGQTATTDWTNLAIIRSNGISTFYIDGVAQAATTLAAPSFGVATAGIHIGVTPGGASWFRGDLDEIRVFTFDPNTDDPVAALSVNAVPEPSTLVLLPVGILGVVWYGRRRRRK